MPNREPPETIVVPPKAAGAIAAMFRSSVKVIGLGLRLGDVTAYNLQDEDVYEQMDPYKLQQQLRLNGATPDEVAFLSAGRRVELNAFTSDDLVEWLDGKLSSLQSRGDIGKVMPDTDTVNRVYRAHVARAYYEKHGGELAERAWKAAEQAPLPDGLEGRIREALKADPTLSWYEAIKEIQRGPST
jgi:hypothetical protein